MLHQKHYVPLESDPAVFSGLMHKLGAATSLQFVDIWSIDDPVQLALIPRPVLALVLVLPTSEAYEQRKLDDEATRQTSTGHGDGEDVMWFKQTIHNACGLYAILHAVCNVPRGKFIQADSILDGLIASCLNLSPLERASVLESSRELENAHATAAHQGSSSVPNAEDEVDHHYVCFVKGANGNLYELDGDLKGPVDRKILLSQDEDALIQPGLDAIRDYIVRENGGDSNFSLLALVNQPSG